MEFLRFFTPSVLRLGDEACRELGDVADLVERAALRRVWEVGSASYQVVAVRVPVMEGSSEFADILVRRRYTLEPGAAIVSGPVYDALRRALAWMVSLREPTVLAQLLEEYNRRGVHAGLAQASAMLQCFVLAPPAVYAEAMGEVNRIRALREDTEPSGLGFHFFTTRGSGDDFRVVGAPPPFDSLALERPVSAIHR